MAMIGQNTVRWVLGACGTAALAVWTYSLLFQEVFTHVETVDSGWGIFTSDAIRQVRNVFEPRRGTLQSPFGFRDSQGTEWLVPAAATFDGASIPQEAWSFVGGPYEGLYFPASIIHDFYSDVKQRPWRQTHLMFYDAMRAAGVEEAQATLMWGAVRYFGPRWQSLGPDGKCLGSCGDAPPDPPIFNKSWFHRYQEWLEFGRDAWEYTVLDEDLFASACDGEGAKVAEALIDKMTEPVAFEALSEFAGFGCPDSQQDQAMREVFAAHFKNVPEGMRTFEEEAGSWKRLFDETYGGVKFAPRGN